ncbi:hypothetical protein EAI_12875 [Harpegnathos saltator]|uniref:Uncharacterized protein n=2 Tax=Harpegnathos saltator TaxID=610380 RepID=E2BWE6_HARSA|nr:hypothetical protein EAI_12875 [Harpegnathos saltator]
MLQTMPRLPVAGVRKRWSNRLTTTLQESSPEVSSSDTISLSYQADMNAAIREDGLQLWSLDLHSDLKTQPDTEHYRTANTAELTSSDRPDSPFPAAIQGR